MFFYVLYFYFYVFVNANITLPNENCTNCYRKISRHFNEIITPHFSEVMISTNLSVNVNIDVFTLKRRCKGVIVSSNMAVSSGSFFENNTSDEYAVYVGYLKFQENGNFRKHYVDKIFLHPDYTKADDVNNIAVVKIKDEFFFAVSGCTKSILPDNLIDFSKTENSDCSLINRQINSEGVNIVRSLIVKLLSREECADLARISNLSLSILMNSFCVKADDTSYKKIDIALGTTCICGEIVRGIVTRNFSRVNAEYPVPFVDIGVHTNWIRGKIINLNQTSRGYPINIHLYTVLLILLLRIFCSDIIIEELPK